MPTEVFCWDKGDMHKIAYICPRKPGFETPACRRCGRELVPCLERH